LPRAGKFPKKQKTSRENWASAPGLRSNNLLPISKPSTHNWSWSLSPCNIGAEAILDSIAPGSLVTFSKPYYFASEVIEVPDNMDTESVIEAVAKGRYDLTVADSHLLELEMSLRDDVQGLFSSSKKPRRGHEPYNPAILSSLRRSMNSWILNIVQSSITSPTTDILVAPLST
jgi:hypothetical protein